MLYQDLVQSEKMGIYTALFDSIKDPHISDLTNTYITAQKLDARFAFENNTKECYFLTFAQAVDVLIAKYFNKWIQLVNNVLNPNLSNGASSITETQANSKNTNNVSPYDSQDTVRLS